MEVFNTIVSLIKDIDFQKTQLMFNLHDMFDIDNNYQLEYELNPFCNNIYFFDSKYTIEIFETVKGCDDIILLDYNCNYPNQLLETPSFENSIEMVENDKYVALKNEDGDWLVMRLDQGEFIKR